MAFPSDLVRTKNWGTETLTDADLEGQLDLIINWIMASQNATTGHKHDGTANEGPGVAKLASTVAGTSTLSGPITISDLAAVTASADLDIGSFKLTAETLESDVATGTAPIVVASTTEVANLNVEQVGGVTGTSITAGLVKAWVNFAGATGTINASLNITSVSRSSQGIYVVTWDTNFDSTNYALSGMTTVVSSKPIVIGWSAIAAGSVTLMCKDFDGALVDPTAVTIMAIGVQV